MSYLVVDNLSARDARGLALFQGVSFELARGHVHTIIGESGAGKSILCNAILGNLPANLSVTGRIALQGRELTKLSQSARRALWSKEIFLLPQEPWQALAQTRSLLSQVRDMSRLYPSGSPTARLGAIQLLESVGLNPEGDGWKRPSELSGGMCQRGAVATALGAPAPLILVDEPTKGLDPQSREDVVTSLKMLLARGRALLLVTHDLKLAEQMSGTISVMGEGAVIEQGCVREVLRNPHHDGTRALLAAQPERWPPRRRTVGRAVAELDRVAIRAGRNGPLLVDDLSLRMHAGEAIGLVGASGSGKTSVGDAILKLRSPARGHVRWLSNAERQKFQKIHQDPHATFAPWRTISETISDALSARDIPRSRLGSVLEPLMKRMRLRSEVLTRLPSQVSGGELQRLALLRALICRPIFLFADEPTSRLDMLTQKSVFEVLAETMAEHAMCMLLVSHDVSVINSTADRVITMGSRKE